MKSFKHYLDVLNYRYNYSLMLKKGWQTNRRIVVIESDDWGSIRIPSKEARDRLQKMEVKLNFDIGYDYCDSLATETDLLNLMDVLNGVKDCNNNPVRVTLNCVMANPDFDKIHRDSYQNYHYEIITETFKRYNNCVKSFDLWKEGMSKGLFRPQFHGREHLNVQMWLNSLQKDLGKMRIAFGEDVFFPQVSYDEDNRQSHLRAFDVNNENQYSFIKTSISEGLDIFESLFGFKSISMIAPNYTWDKEIEEFAFAKGVQYIQGAPFQRYSLLKSAVTKKQGEYHYMGESNDFGQTYLVRNCLWEPTQNKKLNIDYCLKGIEKAFKLKKPAVICAHRLNFIGAIQPENRDNNLKQFSELLKTIVKKWPDVEFMSSDELGEVIINSIEK
ncbi:hypothetical protein ACT3CE_05905 [Marinifilum sp. RC60d5]|uniref:hypothetical protein n=1 Tax=Marinifilum sp. RC60d5 TaxID=3458414 RepID=UPI0040372542